MKKIFKVWDREKKEYADKYRVRCYVENWLVDSNGTLFHEDGYDAPFEPYEEFEGSPRFVVEF